MGWVATLDLEGRTIWIVDALKSPLYLWELDILRHSIRKLRTYEEIHTVFARYLRCDGIYRFLSAGGNDRYGRTHSRANHVYESSFAVTDALAQEARLEFGLRKKRVRR